MQRYWRWFALFAVMGVALRLFFVFKFPLVEGDLILLLTDGFEEALSPDEEFFGMKRVLEHIKAHRHEPAYQIVRTLYHNFRQFTEGAMQLDDLTIVIIKVGAKGRV